MNRLTWAEIVALVVVGIPGALTACAFLGFLLETWAMHNGGLR